MPTLIQAKWDRGTPPFMSQALFPLLTAARPSHLDGEGTHTVMMEKDRMQFFAAVQSFLEQPDVAQRPNPVRSLRCGQGWADL